MLWTAEHKHWTLHYVPPGHMLPVATHHVTSKPLLYFSHIILQQSWKASVGTMFTFHLSPSAVCGFSLNTSLLLKKMYVKFSGFRSGKAGGHKWQDNSFWQSSQKWHEKTINCTTCSNRKSPMMKQNNMQTIVHNSRFYS